jgi:hypothetical protein
MPCMYIAISTVHALVSVALRTLLMTSPRASAPGRCMPSDLLSLARCCVSLLALACRRAPGSPQQLAQVGVLAARQHRAVLTNATATVTLATRCSTATATSVQQLQRSLFGPLAVPTLSCSLTGKSTLICRPAALPLSPTGLVLMSPPPCHRRSVQSAKWTRVWADRDWCARAADAEHASAPACTEHRRTQHCCTAICDICGC